MNNKKYILWVDQHTYDKGYDKKTMSQCKSYWDFTSDVLTLGLENISYISFGISIIDQCSSLCCLIWLKRYCKAENKRMPKCISHSKNKIFNEKFNEILMNL